MERKEKKKVQGKAVFKGEVKKKKKVKKGGWQKKK